MAPANALLLFSASGVLAQEPKILACIAGLPKCVGVPDVATAIDWGCPAINITDCSGRTTTETCGPCVSPRRIGAACVGQGLKNTTAQDGTPVTFSLPVDTSTVKAEYFQWRFPDGSARVASCAGPNGMPASEPNELQTIAIVGDAGGWGDFATSLEIVGDLMLIKPDGSKVSAKGLSYSGPSLRIDQGPVLLTAKYEVFSTAGETLRNSPIGNRAYPNHCQHLFPETTHRIVLLFDGGVSYDGLRGLTPDRADIFQLADADGKPLPQDLVLGLADLGNSVPQSQCEKDTYVHDMDNYVDICLKMDKGAPVPVSVHMPCDAETTIVNPKGSKWPCKPQTVQVTVQTAARAIV